MQLKLSALNKHVKRETDTNLAIDNIHDLSKKTLCPYDEPQFPEKRCVDRECSSCSTAELTKWYSPILDTDGDHMITYDQWKVVEEIKPVKMKGKKEPVQKKMKKLRLVTNTASCRDLVSKLVEDVKPFSAHLFRARWQADQFRQCKMNMPPKSAVLVADFAENYA